MIIYCLAFLLFFSCFNPNKIDNKSGNNFLAYYNTFYTAEKYYNDALEIIQLNESKGEQISSQALSMLDDAIKNALIIEKDFYNTKYIDDSYYILGMSSYYKNNITSSEYYFNRIVNEYNNDKFYVKSLIMLGNLNLKMNKIDKLNQNLSQIEKNQNLTLDEKYLYYLLLADYSNYKEDFENEQQFYLLALENLKTSNDKISIYYKLLSLAENQKDFLNAVSYVESIEILLGDIGISDELLQKWIDYNLELDNYGIIIKRLAGLINKEQSVVKLAYYNLEISKAYIQLKDYIKAEEILTNLIDDYADNTSLKNQLSEGYYLLGDIYMNFEGDLKKSQEYFQYSIDKSKSSAYGKKSSNIITSISNYNNLMDEILYMNVNSQDNAIDTVSQSLSFDIPVLKNTDEYNGLDSLIFNAGQILLFDLGLVDSAIFKFENIIYNYPKSDYRYKSLMIIDMEKPDSKLQDIVKEEYNELNVFSNKYTAIDSMIDASWNKIIVNVDTGVDDLLDIYKKYNNDRALYIIGFIYDDYFKDIDNSLYYYNMYIEKFPDGSFSNKITNRISEIEGMLEFNFKFMEQRLNSRKGIQFFKDEFQIDSSLFYLNLGSEGVDRELKSYCKNILESIKLYSENDSLYKINYLNLDSVKINLANILYKELSLDSLSISYYKDIINNIESPQKNINESLAALSVIYDLGKWDSLLYSNVQDSSLFNLLKNNSYRKFKYDFKASFKQDIDDYNWYYSTYNQYFKIDNSSDINFE